MFVAFLHSLLFIFMVLLSFFLILIILLQRGKGGGLVGAFGGMGGSSAFGAKTSDVFLKITIWAAIVWFVTCIGGRFILDMRAGKSMLEQASQNAIAIPGQTETPDAAATDSTEAATTAPADAQAPAEAASEATPEAPATDAPASESPAE